MKKTPEQRFWERVGDHSDPNACWLWIGPTKDGYGVFLVDQNKKHIARSAHRYSYILHVGPIPEGYTIDHVKAKGCSNTLCVNPAHLEAVTLRVNVLRGNGPAARNAKKTHCPKGHPYDEENTYVSARGSRFCRACDRLIHKARRQAKS